MSDRDAEVVINFGNDSVVRGQHHLVLRPGNRSDNMFSEYKYDLIYAIDGYGAVRWDGKTEDLNPGGQVKVPNGATYSIDSGPDAQLTAVIYCVDEGV